MRRFLRLRRSDLLLVLAALVLITQLVLVVGAATAKQRNLLAQKRERQLRVLVASGDDVAIRQKSQRAGTRAPRLARTGIEVDGILSLGLVLMLDGALVLMAVRPRRVRF